MLDGKNLNNRIALKKSLTIGIIFLFIGTGVLPNICGHVTKTDNIIRNSSTQHYSLSSNNDALDVQYIYNITEALSNIIFTEYDEENGEIAKGRFFWY